MTLDINMARIGQAAEITLVGELDAVSAPKFQHALEAVAAGKPTRLVLRLRDLTYMASAGIRTLIFAKHKMGANVDLYVIAPQPLILETLQRTGLIASVIVQDDYPGETPAALREVQTS